MPYPEIVFVRNDGRWGINQGKGIPYARFDSPKFNVAYQAGFNESKELLDEMVELLLMVYPSDSDYARMRVNSMIKKVKRHTIKGFDD